MSSRLHVSALRKAAPLPSRNPRNASDRSYASIPTEHSNLHLTTLRRALANSDLPTTENELQNIISSNALNQLGIRDFKDVNRLLHSQPTSSSVPKHSTQIAIHLALKGHADYLNSIMTSALRNKQYSVVIGLWSKLKDTQLSQLTDEFGDQASFLSSSRSRHRRLDATLNKCLERAMSCVVTAHCASGQRSEALRSTLGLYSSIDITTINHPSPTNPHTPETIQNLRSLPEDIDLARLLEHPRGVLNHFAAAFERGDVNGAVKTLQHIDRGIQAGWIAPIDICGWFDDDARVVSMTEPVWSAIVGGFMRANRIDIAKALWQRMTELKITKTSISWNALLEGYARRGHYEELAQVWKAMLAAGVEKDVFTYTTAISGFFQAKHSDYALNLWNEMRQKIEGDLATDGTVSKDASATESRSLATKESLVVPYNAVIHGLLISARAEQALRLFDDMREKGPPPDITTVNTFIRHYSRKGDMSSIAHMLRQLPSLHIKPDIFTFTSVLHACLRSGVPTSEAVKRVESAMKASGITPNVVMYSAIIDQTVRQGGHENILAGFGWLDAMERQGMKPNEVTFTSLLAALKKDHSLPRDFVEQKTAEVNRRMSQHGARRNRVTYNILIKASLENTDPKGMEDAMELYHQMVNEGIKPNDDTWFLLLDGVHSRSATKFREVLLADMSASGFVPSGAVARIVRRVRTTSNLSQLI